MFRKRTPPPEAPIPAQPATDAGTADETPQPRKGRNRWIYFSIIANFVLVGVILIGVGASAILYQSDTNPEFCATCHVMQPNVDSYLHSDNLDHVHAEAGVECKECHSDYTIPDEITSGVNYVTGNYQVDENGLLLKRDFRDQICTQCHGSPAEMELATDYLFYNPHGTLMGTFECSLCHTSHGEQRDYCTECHEAPGQRLLGDTSARIEQIAVPESKYGAANPYGNPYATGATGATTGTTSATATPAATATPTVAPTATSAGS